MPLASFDLCLLFRNVLVPFQAGEIVRGKVRDADGVEHDFVTPAEVVAVASRGRSAEHYVYLKREPREVPISVGRPETI